MNKEFEYTGWVQMVVGKLEEKISRENRNISERRRDKDDKRDRGKEREYL